MKKTVRTWVDPATKKWFASLDDGPEFLVGRDVKYRQYRGLMGQGPAGSARYSPGDFSDLGFWSQFIAPTASCESRGAFAALNTHDRARFTFGFMQFGAHQPDQHFVLVLRKLLALPSAESYFPDLDLHEGRIARVADGVRTHLESASETTALTTYLNPRADKVDDVEVERAARLVDWTTREAEARRAQVEVAVEAAKKSMAAHGDTYALDGVSDVICCVIYDIHHQGRGPTAEVRAALRERDAYTALLAIGAVRYPGRAEELRREIDARVTAGLLGARVWRTTKQTFELQKVAPPRAAPQGTRLRLDGSSVPPAHVEVPSDVPAHGRARVRLTVPSKDVIELNGIAATGPWTPTAGRLSIPLFGDRLLVLKLERAPGAIKAWLSGTGLREDLPLSGAEGDTLRFGSASVAVRGEILHVDLPRDVLPPSWSVLPGHLDVRGDTCAITLAVHPEASEIRLVPPPEGAQLGLDFDLFFREAGGRDIAIDVAKTALASKLVALRLPLPAAVPLARWAEGRTTLLLPALAGGKADLGAAALKGFAGRITDGLAEIRLLPPRLEAAKELDAAWSEAGLEIRGLALQLETTESKVHHLDRGVLRLDRELRLLASDAGIAPLTTIVEDLTVVEPIVLAGGVDSPFTIIIQKDARLSVCLDGGQPALVLDHPSGVPATCYIPGVAGHSDTPPTDRFILDVRGESASRGDDTPCRLTPSGLELHARIRAGRIDLGGASSILGEGYAEDGGIDISGGDVSLFATASARLPYFQGARGALTLAASSRAGSGGALELSARFEVRTNQSWLDPSGLLELRRPSAWVTVSWKKGWTAEGGVSGTLVITPPREFADDSAREWFEDLFASIELDFHDLGFDQLAAIGRGQLPTVDLKLKLARPVVLRLWKLLTFNIRSFSLGWNGIGVGGDIDLNIPSLDFGGSLPKLLLSLEGGRPRIGIGGLGADFQIHGGLKLLSGTKAQLELRRESGLRSDSLGGTGALTIPGLPEIRVTTRIGREWRDDRYVPLFFLFVEADYPVVVFPGVVLRWLGLGFGVNQVLAGFEAIIGDGGKSALEDLTMPDPSSLDGWTSGDGFMLAARTFVAPSVAGGEKEIFPYLADAVMGIDEHFSIVLFSNLWLFTNKSDARTPGFRRYPLAQGVVSIYPRNKRLEARFTTKKSPRMSLMIPLLPDVLAAVQAEVSLIASPDLFRLRIGPLSVNAELAGLRFQGRSLIAVEVSERGVVALYSLSLAASFETSLSFGFALVHVRIGLWGRFATELMLAGGVVGGRLLFYGRATLSVAAGINIYVEIGFRIRIKCFGFSINISWTVRMSASLSIAFEARVEAVMGTQFGLEGEGTLMIDVFGFQLRPSLSFALGDRAGLIEARSGFSKFLQP